MKNKYLKKILVVLLVVIVFEFITQYALSFFNQIAWGVIQNGKYNRELIAELIALLFVICAVFLTKKRSIFKNKSNFIEGVKLGGPITWMAIIFTVFNSVKLIFEGVNFYNFLSMTLFILFVGLFEEILYRGIIQNELIDGSNGKKQIVTSLLLTAFIFGFGHFSNVFYGQSLFETIIQVFQTTAIGLILGLAYYKSKNIWSVIFIHFLYDFSIMLSNINVYKDCEYVKDTDLSVMFAMSGVTIALILIYFAYSYFTINKLDFNKDKVINKKKKDKIIIIVMIISVWSIVGSFLLLNNKIDDNYICYEYDNINIDKYELHSYSYSDFKVMDYNIKLDNQKIYLKDNYNLEERALDIDNVYKLIVDYDNEEIDITFLVIESNEYLIYNIKRNINVISDIKNIDNYDIYTLPRVSSIGYLIDYNTSIKYPFVKTTTEDIFIIKDNKVQVLNK